MPSKVSSRALGSGVVTAPKMAANALTVTANSASTVGANTINFTNTATVTVTVGSGGSGISNVSFTSTSTASDNTAFAFSYWFGR